MFGYIRPFRPELRIKEEEAYRSVYCGLCKELGKNYGVFARLTLSYDFTFLAILAMGLGQGEPSFSKVRCLANPLKQCVACRQDKITPAIAAKAMITLYYKSLDQLCDERLFTRLPVYAVFPLFRHAWKKARQTEPETERLAAEMTQKQAAAETQQAGPDQAAEPTADFLACVCESLKIRRPNPRLIFLLASASLCPKTPFSAESCIDSATYWAGIFIFPMRWMIWKKTKQKSGSILFCSLVPRKNGNGFPMSPLQTASVVPSPNWQKHLNCCSLMTGVPFLKILYISD